MNTITNEVVTMEIKENGFCFIRNTDENSRNPNGVVTFIVKPSKMKKLLKLFSESEKTFSALWSASIEAGCNPDFRAF